MNEKTLTGVDFFDARYGGIYRGRCALACGRSGSGKSALALQFLHQGLRLHERCLLLSTRPAEEVALFAAALDLPIDIHVESGALVVLEYSQHVPGQRAWENTALPPEGFAQFQQIIDAQAIQRVALDTALPWVVLPTPERLPEHVFSMIRAFQRLGATTLMTLPNPVSRLALRLKRQLEEVMPISIQLLHTTGTETRTWIVNKFLGLQAAPLGMPFEIVSGRGIVGRPPDQPDTPPPAGAARATPTPTPTEEHLRLSSLLPGAGTRPTEPATGMKPAPKAEPPDWWQPHVEPPQGSR